MMTPKNQTKDRTMHEQRKQKIFHQILANHNTNMMMPVDFFLTEYSIYSLVPPLGKL